MSGEAIGAFIAGVVASSAAWYFVAGLLISNAIDRLEIRLQDKFDNRYVMVQSVRGYRQEHGD